MTTEQIEKIIGQETERRITAGRYGDTGITANGFIVGDPCYWMPDSSYSALMKAAFAQQPAAYHGTVREWVGFQFRGRTAYFKTCGDGCGPFGFSVDSGWVCAVPAFSV